MEEEHEVRKIDAMLLFHFHINPESLSDDEWADKWGQLEWVLKQESQKWD